jgi:hypothetical protein
LFADRRSEVLVDGHHGIAAHLVVAVVQVGGALRVSYQAVDAQPGGVTDAQPGADEDLDQQAHTRVGEPGEVGLRLQLSHDWLGQRPRRRVGVVAGMVVGVDGRIGR